MTKTFTIDFHDISDVQPGKKVQFCYVLVNKDLELRTAWWDPSDNGFWNSMAEDAMGVGDVHYWALSKEVKVSR
jgi:hypothetical protein